MSKTASGIPEKYKYEEVLMNEVKNNVAPAKSKLKELEIEINSYELTLVI